MELNFRGSTLKTLLFKKFRGEIQLFTSEQVRRSSKLPFEPRHDWSLRSRIMKSMCANADVGEVRVLRVGKSTTVVLI